MGNEIFHFLLEAGCRVCRSRLERAVSQPKRHVEQGSYTRRIGVVFRPPPPVRPHGSVSMPITLYYIIARCLPIVRLPSLDVLQPPLNMR